MANQTVVCSSDAFLDESAPTENRGSVNHLNFGVTSNDDLNPVWTFDVSSLAGKMWDSVTLTLTYFGSITSGSGSGTKFLAHLDKALVASTCTWEVFSAGNGWASFGAETSADHNAATRVEWFMDQARAVDDVEVSPDITGIIMRALHANAGTLHLILFSTGPVGGSVHQYDSVETTNGTQGFLTFTNVQDQETTTSSNPTGTAANVAVPSASVRSKSGRPPIAGADRQVSASIIHDGVEPMTILAITLKGAFGADN